MIGAKPEDMAELINDFVAVLPKQMHQMREHGSNGDLAALRIAAHSCKSNARDLGALHLAELCARLETEAAAAKVTELCAHMAGIAQAADTALALYAKLDPSDV
jgi:HPt (histidine-containing phosphotransfer) domain-containing protein